MLDELYNNTPGDPLLSKAFLAIKIYILTSVLLQTVSQLLSPILVPIGISLVMVQPWRSYETGIWAIQGYISNEYHGSHKADIRRWSYVLELDSITVCYFEVAKVDCDHVIQVVRSPVASIALLPWVLATALLPQPDRTTEEHAVASQIDTCFDAQKVQQLQAGNLDTVELAAYVHHPSHGQVVRQDLLEVLRVSVDATSLLSPGIEMSFGTHVNIRAHERWPRQLENLYDRIHHPARVNALCGTRRTSLHEGNWR